MNRNRSVRRLALAATFVAVFALPGAARAGSIDLSSSLSAYCIGSVCTMMRLVMDLPSSASWVDRVSIFNNNPGWGWGAVWSVTDQNGAGLPWSYGLSGNELFLNAPGPMGEGPVTVTLSMWKWGSHPDQFVQSASVVGDGNEPVVDPPIDPPVDPGNTGGGGYGGTATPEPATVLLLGTGLAGVVGAARRKRSARTDG